MKRNLLFIVFLCCTCLGIYAAPFRFLETIVTQADGSQLALYASGDEFYHWIHDKDGYTIVQAEDGYCYYAIKNDKGELVPSTSNPQLSSSASFLRLNVLSSLN